MACDSKPAACSSTITFTLMVHSSVPAGRETQVSPRVEIQHSVLAPPNGDCQKFNARAQLQTLLNFDSLIATPFALTLSFKSITDKTSNILARCRAKMFDVLYVYQFKPHHTRHGESFVPFLDQPNFSNLINSFAARDR